MKTYTKKNVKKTKSFFGINKKRKKTRSSVVKKHSKLFITGFVAFVFSTLALALFWAYNVLHVEKTNATNQIGFSDSVNFGEGIYTNIIVVRLDDKFSENPKIKNLILFSARENPNKYYMYQFPVNTEIKIPRFNNYEKFNLEDAYKISTSKNAKFTKFLKSFCINYLGVDVDGYIVIDDSSYNDISKSFGSINYDDLAHNLRIKNSLKIPGLIKNTLQKSETNLSLSDVLSILQYIKNTGKNSSYHQIISSMELSDISLWDSVWRRSLDMNSVQKEGMKVLVLNASKNPKIAGLGNWGARLVNNAGGLVLSTENSFTDFNENTIISEERDSKTTSFLMNILGLPLAVDLNTIDRDANYNPEVLRSKITLVLVDFYE